MAILPQTEPVPFGPDDEGVLRIGGTRVTLDTVVAAFNAGATAEQIAQDYPTLNLSDIYSVIGFFLRHRADVEEYLQQQQRGAQEVRRQIESASELQGIRERLLERQGGHTVRALGTMKGTVLHMASDFDAPLEMW